MQYFILALNTFNFYRIFFSTKLKLFTHIIYIYICEYVYNLKILVPIQRYNLMSYHIRVMLAIFFFYEKIMIFYKVIFFIRIVIILFLDIHGLR